MAEDTKKRELKAGATPAGRVRRDSDGRAVRQWSEEECAAGTSVLLKVLDNDALSLEPTQTVPVPYAAGPQVTGGGSTEATSVMLRRLAGDGLSLEGTWRVEVGELRAPDPGSRWGVDRAAGGDDEDGASEAGGDIGGGFNPYAHS